MQGLCAEACCPPRTCAANGGLAEGHAAAGAADAPILTWPGGRSVPLRMRPPTIAGLDDHAGLAVPPSDRPDTRDEAMKMADRDLMPPDDGEHLPVRMCPHHCEH